jgi:hypothetical protein
VEGALDGSCIYVGTCHVAIGEEWLWLDDIRGFCHVESSGAFTSIAQEWEMACVSSWCRESL